MSSNKLMDLLKGMVNVAVSGQVEDIKVLSHIDVRESDNSIYIIGTGLNEYEEEIPNDSYSINLNNVKEINQFLDSIELGTKDNKIIILSQF